MLDNGKGISSSYTWDTILEDKTLLTQLEETILPVYINTCRWFAGKGSPIKKLTILQAQLIHFDKNTFYLLLLKINFNESNSQDYLLPIAFDENTNATPPGISKMIIDKKEGILTDALHLSTFRDGLMTNITQNSKIISPLGDVIAFEKSDSFNTKDLPEIHSVLLKAEQSNTSIIFNELYFFKWYRRVYTGNNPDLEISRFLNSSDFSHTAQYLGCITWNRKSEDSISMGLLQKKVPNEGDAWPWMLKQVDSFLKFAKQHSQDIISLQPELFKAISPASLSPKVMGIIGADFIEGILLLGKRTAEMHVALGRQHSNSDFTPIPFTPEYSTWLTNKFARLVDDRMHLLEKNLDVLNGLAKEYGSLILHTKNEILHLIHNFDVSSLTSLRTRIHGDYHLGQVLVHQKDFYILDFEGEPESSIEDRKIKQSPLKDVAGMLRSFHYAIYAALFNISQPMNQSQPALFELVEKYYQLICGIFLHSYLKTTKSGGLDMGDATEFNYLVRYHILEKAIYELGYELNSRPAWASIPLRGIIQILNYKD